MRPDVSVVIPTKDRPTHLLRAVGCALGQVGVDPEVIVVDDGSAVHAAELLRDVGAHAVRVLRHDRSRGVSAARNAGIAAASAGWVAFLDDDDLWAPTKLASQLAAVSRAVGDAPPVAWSCAASVLIDPTDRLVGWACPPKPLVTAADLLVANVVPAGGSGMLVSTAALAAVGGFDEGLSLYEDWDLWVRLALRGPGAVVGHPLVAYRVWQSVSGGPVNLASAWEVVRARHEPEADRLGVVADRRDLMRYRAYRSLRTGRHREAGQAYRELAALEGTVRVKAAALLAPRFGGALLRTLSWRDRRAVPKQVRADAERWLERLQAPTSAD